MLKTRRFITLSLIVLGMLTLACGSAPAGTAQSAAKPAAKAATGTDLKFGTAPGLKPLAQRTGNTSKVYFTRDISSKGSEENL
jgi:hypothetical protein